MTPAAGSSPLSKIEMRRFHEKPEDPKPIPGIESDERVRCTIAVFSESGVTSSSFSARGLQTDMDIGISSISNSHTVNADQGLSLYKRAALSAAFQPDKGSIHTSESLASHRSLFHEIRTAAGCCHCVSRDPEVI